MKHLISITAFLLAAIYLHAQNYPDPEFTNEVYYLKKDSVHSLVRLEKTSAKLEGKSKGAGFGGYENGYVLDGDKSAVRLSNGSKVSFVFATGSAGAGSSNSSAYRDSIMKANGADPTMMSGMASMTDPANTINLYKADLAKGKRKILMQKVGGAFGGGKVQSSDKYTFSVKKVRDGYWELVVDKPLPKGEYAFTLAAYMNTGAMDGSTTLFTFGID